MVTDTRYYWNISENIFRYTHHNLGKVDNALAGGVHTVNERTCVICPVSVHCVLVSDVIVAVRDGNGCVFGDDSVLCYADIEPG